MTLLPAVIPPIPEARSEVVPARLARKVAPLFGVSWPESALGPTTWVTDFNRVTLSEIARGAPLPTRSESAALTAAALAAPAGWALVNRVGVTAPNASLPNEIANATLNRYGPDTRAAVVLAAVNRLLDPLRAALEEAIPLLVDEAGTPLPTGLRLAGWASVVVEVFRSQPALVAAGIRARAIQRPLTTVWDVPRGASAAAEPLTRCEIGAEWTTAAPLRPRDLDLVDATFWRLDLLPAVAANPIPGQSLHEVLVGELLHRLLDVGSLRDTSHLWISARGPGQLAVEVLLTPTSIVDRFVRQALRSMGIAKPPPAKSTGKEQTEGNASGAYGTSGVSDNNGQPEPSVRAEDAADPDPENLDGAKEPAIEWLDDGRALPGIPDPARLAGQPLLVRRASTIALLGVVRQVQSSRSAVEAAREVLYDRLGSLRRWVVQVLPEDDPVLAVATCRIDVNRLALVRDQKNRDLRTLVNQLTYATRRCVKLFDAGVLDRGAAAEIVSASNAQLYAVRLAAGGAGSVTSVTDPPGSAVPADGRRPDAQAREAPALHALALDEPQREGWRDWLRIVEAEPDELLGERNPDDPDLLGYHLHNYAAFLASTGRDDDLAAAAALFRGRVLPAREKFLRRTGLFGPLGTSLQMAAAASTAIAESAAARDDLDAARAWAALGHQRITRALAEPTFRAMVDDATVDSCRFAIRAAAALVLAAELGAVGGEEELDEASWLLEKAREWVKSGSGGYVRQAEIDTWSDRLDRLRGA